MRAEEFEAEMLPGRVWVVWPGYDYPRAYLPASEVREHFRHPEQAGEYVRADLHAAEVQRLREALVQVVNAGDLGAAQLVADEALRVPATGHNQGVSRG